MAGSRCRYGFSLIFISIILLICCSLSAAADEDTLVYSVRSDTLPVRSSGSWLAYDYGAISAGAYTTHSITNNEDFWLYTNHSLARGFVDLYGRLDAILSADNGINSRLNTTNSSITTLISKMWGNTSSPITVWRMNTTWDDTAGSQQVNTLADAIALDSINNMYTAYWTKKNYDELYGILSGVNSTVTGLTTLDGSVTSASALAHSDSSALGDKIFDSSFPTSNTIYYHNQTGGYTSTSYPAYLGTSNGGYSLVSAGSVTSLRDYLDLINRDLIVNGNMLFNFTKSYTQDRYNLSTHSSSSSSVRSLADSLTYGFSDLSDFVGRIASVFASDDDIQAREDADPQIQQAQEDFISPDGAASVKLRDMGNAKDVSSSLQSSLETGVSPSTSFSYFRSNSGLFTFFSSDCAANLDQSPVTRSDSSETFIDFYSPNFRQIGVPFDD